MPTLHRNHLALLLLVLSTLAALLLAGIVAWGMQLTPATALAALAVSGVLFAGMAWLHGEMRAARWNAGHRLR